MNAKTSVFVICVEAIIFLLLYNLHDCTFKGYFPRQKVKDFRFCLGKFRILISGNLLKNPRFENQQRKISCETKTTFAISN